MNNLHQPQITKSYINLPLHLEMLKLSEFPHEQYIIQVIICKACVGEERVEFKYEVGSKSDEECR